jgi:hypothetical protein
MRDKYVRTLCGIPQVYKKYYSIIFYKIAKKCKTDCRLAGGCKIKRLLGCVTVSCRNENVKIKCIYTKMESRRRLHEWN